MVELDELGIVVGRIFSLRVLRVGDMLHEVLAIRLEERPHVVRKRIHGFVRDQALCVFTPAKRRGQLRKIRATAARARGKVATASDIASFRARRGLIPRGELAVPPSVEVIEAQADSQPNEESNPAYDRQSRHQQQACEDRCNRRRQTARSTERTGTFWLFITENQHAGSHESQTRRASRYWTGRRACRYPASPPEFPRRNPRPRWRNPACDNPCARG